jgi:dipeptidyl aminopeptidase/acylaminoacyl peptidase
VVLVHGTDDDVVPFAQSRDYATAARAAGTPVTLHEVAGAGHSAHLDPASPALDPVWAALRRL